MLKHVQNIHLDRHSSPFSPFKFGFGPLLIIKGLFSTFILSFEDVIHVAEQDRLEPELRNPLDCCVSKAVEKVGRGLSVPVLRRIGLM